MQKHNEDVRYPYKLFFYDCIWEEDKIIYPASNCNSICETNIFTGKTIVIGKADEEKERLLFHGIYKWKDYLVLPGRYARCAISLFNLEKGDWSYINIDESRKDCLNFREQNVFEYNGFLYIFPFSLTVLKVNIERKKIEYLFYPDINYKDDMRGEIAYIENIVYVPLKHKSILYKFDLKTEEWDIIKVNTELKGIDTLCFDGKLFWMSGIGRMICSWDEKNNISVTYNKFPSKFNKLVNRMGEQGFWFSTSIVYGKSIYFVPCDANMLIEFDIDNNEAKELFIEDEWETKEDMRAGRFSTVKYMGAKRKDNILMMLSNKNKNLIFIDLETKAIRKVELKLSIREGIVRLIPTTLVMYEWMTNLNNWLEYVRVIEKGYKVKNESSKESIGGKIYFSH